MFFSVEAIKLTVNDLHDHDVPAVSDCHRMNQILRNLLSLRKDFQQDRDNDVAVWKDMIDASPEPIVLDFFNVARRRRLAAFDAALDEIDGRLRAFTDELKSAVDYNSLDKKLEVTTGAYSPALLHKRPKVHPKLSFAQFGRSFFENASVPLPDADTWSWSVCGTADSNARALLARLNGPFPHKLLQSIDSTNLDNTEFQLQISGFSITAFAPLIAVKLYCFCGKTLLFTSDSMLLRPSIIPFQPCFVRSQTQSLSESGIFSGEGDALPDLDGSSITVKLNFQHIASVKNRQLLFVLYRDDGHEPSFSDEGLASVSVGLDSFFAEMPASVELPLFNRTVDVDSKGEIIGLRQGAALWSSDVADDSKLAMELSAVCVIQFQGRLCPQNLFKWQSFSSEHLSFQNFKQFLSDCDIPARAVDSNELFFIELVCYDASLQQQHSALKFHIVDLSHASYLPVLFTGQVSPVCSCLFEISAVVDWSISEDVCVILEQGIAFLPVCRLKVCKEDKISAKSCNFICMRHPDPTSTSILVGSRQSGCDDRSERFIPEFVNWQSQFFATGQHSDLEFEGKRFGFERGEQYGCWVSFFESTSDKSEQKIYVNVTNGTFDATFDPTNYLCPEHKKRCDRILNFSSLVARRIFVCESCVASIQNQQSKYCILDVASDGFTLARKAVENQLPRCDPFWKLLQQLRKDAKSLQDYDIFAELDALQRGMDMCLEKITKFVVDRAKGCIPEPNVLQAFPASDVSLLYQCMDALCSSVASSTRPETPYIFPGYSGVWQLGYAQALEPKKLGYIPVVSINDCPDTMSWQLVDTDSQGRSKELFQLALDVNFVVCTRGYVNSSARRDAGKVFVRRQSAGQDVYSNKALSVGFEVDVSHKALRSVKRRDISIVAWLRRDPVPNVHIANLTRPKEADSDEFLEISDDDINLVNNEMVDLSADLIKVTNVANLPYNTACIIYSINNDIVFRRLRTDVLHIFSNPDVMLAAVDKMREMSLLCVSLSDALVRLPFSELDDVEKKVLTLASRIIFAQNCGVPLKVTGLLNDSGIPMTLPVAGSDLISITNSSANPNTYYCSRILGRDAIPGSDGQCGPNNGPQCKDCKAAQDFYMSRQKSASVTPGPCLPDDKMSYASINSSTMQKLQVFLGDHIKMQTKADERPIICTVIPDKCCPDGCVRLSPHTCAKLSLRLGDTVRVQVCNVSFARRIMYRFVGPAPAMQFAHETVSFKSCCVSVDDMFRFRIAGADFNVRIMCTDPEGVCMVTSDSEIFCDSSFSEDIQHVVDSSPLVPATKPSDFPSRGDLICLQRDDSSTSTLLRKRATSSRYAFSRVMMSLTRPLTPNQGCI